MGCVWLDAWYCSRVTKIVIATRNAHKVGEIRAILGERFQYLTLEDFPQAPKVVEDADTFAGNATKKAVALARWLAGNEQFKTGGAPACILADDSGLEVDALGGAPGVHSARFAAMDKTENAKDADNNAKLLRLLQDVPLEKRTARFRCVIALAPIAEEPVESASPVCYADEDVPTFDGACEGRIQLSGKGAKGFGYDPLFVPDGFTESFAELGEEVKNKLSHRAKALEKLKWYFGRP
jgi:XTP/dITP diphosphohydrolase